MHQAGRGVVKIDLSGIGQMQPAGGPLQEGDAQTLLQHGHPMADGGGWQPQQTRRSAEAAGLYDLDEYDDLIEVHLPTQ
ncbi:hypothetical protein D3C76_1408990 [compost metagenome]